MPLVALQNGFQARVLDGTQGIEAALVGSGESDFPERLAAYTEGYRSRLVEALETTYPALRSVLGAERFEAHARAYIETHPSRHFSVRYYGGGLGDFLQARVGAVAGRTLEELARWEWTLAEVFDAPDDVPLAAEPLAAVAAADWPGLRFHLRASAQRLSLRTNAVEWWRSVNGLAAVPAALAEAGRTEWLLWRRGVKTLFRSLDAVEAAAIDAVRGGGSFAAVCERLAALVDASQAEQRAASLLRGWIGE